MKGILLISCFILIHTFNCMSQPVSTKTANELKLLLQKSRPDTNRLALLFNLSRYYISASLKQPYITDILPDSAIPLLKSAISLGDSLGSVYYKNESRCLLGKIWFRVGNIAEGKRYFIQVIKYYQAEGDKENEAKTWFLMGNSIKKEPRNMAEIRTILAESLLLYKQLNNREAEAGTRIEIANLWLMEGKLTICEKELLEVLKIYGAIAFKKPYNAYYLLAVTYRYQGDFAKSLSYATKCVQNMEAVKETGLADFYYGELALVYESLGQLEESIHWYKKALERREQINTSKIYIFRTAGFLVQQLIKQKKENEALALIFDIVKKHPPLLALEKATIAQNLGYCYEAKKLYATAEKYYLEMIEGYDESGYEDEFVAIADLDMGRFYLNRQQYNKSVTYLKKALNYPPGTNPLTRQKDIELMLFVADSALGNYQSAIKHLRQHKILNDSIFNETKSRQIEELKIQYETGRKDQLINLKEENIRLLTKQGELQQIKLQQAGRLRNITLAGVALLIIIVALMYNRYRLKQRTNKKLEIQQKEINQKNNSLRHLLDEKEWLLKEIHHRVKNNLHTIIGLLDTQSGFLRSEEAVLALSDSQHRIQTMSLIHQKLYQSEDLSTIEMSAYIHELTAYLKHSFNTGQRILFKLNIAYLELKLSHSLPLGLILNEAITNSIKYAFPEDRDGVITVLLEHVIDDNYLLTIADNGIGLPQGFNHQAGGSMGMSLMQGLSEDIQGTFSINNNHGTEIKISFLYNPSMADSLDNDHDRSIKIT